METSLRRDAARSFFQSLESYLRDDEILADKQCVRMILEKEAAASRNKRFDADRAFARRLLYDRFDAFLSGWLRKRQIKADPFRVLRYEGPERGPTQHQTAVGPSLGYIGRIHDRLAEQVPEIPDSRKAVARSPTSAIAPAFRLQFPLPFGAAGEVKYEATLKDLYHGTYLAALDAATGGDSARGWNYDAGLFVAYASDRPRRLLGDELWEAWPEVHERVWKAARVWIVLI